MLLKIREVIDVSMRRSSFTNVKGRQVEYSAINITNDQRHFHREARSQMSQLDSVHRHGFRNDVKIPIKHKLT